MKWSKEKGLKYKDTETEQKCFKKMVLGKVEKAANSLSSRQCGLNLYTRSPAIGVIELTEAKYFGQWLFRRLFLMS